MWVCSCLFSVSGLGMLLLYYLWVFGGWLGVWFGWVVGSGVCVVRVVLGGFGGFDLMV